MMIISFAWTTPAVKADRKTCTRREWDDDFASRFHVGGRVQGYDKNPRNGGKKFCIIEITDLYKERLCDIPMADWDHEGFGYLTGIKVTLNGLMPIEIWNSWKKQKHEVWVVRFKVVKDG